MKSNTTMENNVEASSYRDTIEKAKALLVINPIEGLRLYCTIVVDCSTQELENIHLSLSDVSCDDSNIAYQMSFLLCKIIENKNATKNHIDFSFRKIIAMLESSNHEIADKAFNNIQYGLEGFENERYSLLYIYLNNTLKINVLEDFFYGFKDPKYVFDVLVRRYEVHGFRLSLDKFSNIIAHYWNSSKEVTEKCILAFFSQEQFGMLAVKVMLCGSNYPYRVNLKNLKSKEEQKLAIECICDYPHSIDKLLPIVLELRNSPYGDVKTFLQAKLAELIFNGYHNTLLMIVEKHLTNSAADKKFLIPLVKSSKAYDKMREFKNSVDDLNPWENERNLVDLYYRLEHETQATMMKDNQKDNSFLSMLKNTTIVRGNAWKHEDDDTISPLHLIQSKVMVDSRAYKNPLAYEQKLENL